jgi:hypothetical protein
MQIFTSEKPLSWGKLDVPLFGLTKDWFGSTLEEPSTFSLVQDSEFLWFILLFPKTASIHPDSSPGQFTPELWKYDVAELFLANPTTGEYLEFNLTSNGAWWASKFSSPRFASPKQPHFTSEIRSCHDLTGKDHSVVALKIPIKFLKMEMDFSEAFVGNITMIRDSPSQRYLSAFKLPGAQPDFHQPQHFLPITFTSLPVV